MLHELGLGGGGLGPVQQLGEQPVVPRLTHPQLGLHSRATRPAGGTRGERQHRGVQIREPGGSNDSCPRPASAPTAFCCPDAVQALDAEPDLMLGVDNVALVAVRLHPEQHPHLRRLTRPYTPRGTAVLFEQTDPADGERATSQYGRRLPGGRPQSCKGES